MEHSEINEQQKFLLDRTAALENEEFICRYYSGPTKYVGDNRISFLRFELEIRSAPARWSIHFAGRGANPTVSSNARSLFAFQSALDSGVFKGVGSGLTLDPRPHEMQGDFGLIELSRMSPGPM
jgi:hypothetical protein